MPAVIQHPTLMPFSSNNYITEAVLRSAPVAPQPLTSNGYVSHDAIARVSHLRHTDDQFFISQSLFSHLMDIHHGIKLQVDHLYILSKKK